MVSHSRAIQIQEKLEIAAEFSCVCVGGAEAFIRHSVLKLPVLLLARTCFRKRALLQVLCPSHCQIKIV